MLIVLNFLYTSENMLNLNRISIDSLFDVENVVENVIENNIGMRYYDDNLLSLEKLFLDGMSVVELSNRFDSSPYLTRKNLRLLGFPRCRICGKCLKGSLSKKYCTSCRRMVTNKNFKRWYSCRIFHHRSGLLGTTNFSSHASSDPKEELSMVRKEYLKIFMNRRGGDVI